MFDLFARDRISYGISSVATILRRSVLGSTRICKNRVADVEGTRDRRSPKSQGLLRKEGLPTYTILSQNLVLSQFACFLKGFHRAFYESHSALGELSMKFNLLLKGFQQKSASFHRGFGESTFVEPAFGELSQSFRRACFRRPFGELS